MRGHFERKEEALGGLVCKVFTHSAYKNAGEFLKFTLPASGQGHKKLRDTASSKMRIRSV